MFEVTLVLRIIGYDINANDGTYHIAKKDGSLPSIEAKATDDFKRVVEGLFIDITSIVPSWAKLRFNNLEHKGCQLNLLYEAEICVTDRLYDGYVWENNHV